MLILAPQDKIFFNDNPLNVTKLSDNEIDEYLSKAACEILNTKFLKNKPYVFIEMVLLKSIEAAKKVCFSPNSDVIYSP